jgi:hypothetical protein
VGKAREIGLAAEEVEVAVEVGRRVRQGAAGALDRAGARLGMTASAAAACAPTAHAARGCCG